MPNLLINIWVCPKCGAYVHINDFARYGHSCPSNRNNLTKKVKE